MHKIRKAICFLALLTMASFLPASASAPNPYEFNVYAIQNIGTSSSYYGSDYQGIAGAGGNVYFTGFSLNANGSYNPSQPYSLFTGGGATFGSGSVNNGGISSGGNINLTSTTVNGPISGGGNLQGGTGQVNGNVSITGTNSSALTINGSLTTGAAYSSTLDHAAVASYFNNASSFWGGLSATSSWVNSYGQIQVSNLSSGRNIVNLNASDLSGIYGLKLSGPSDAFVVFNITGLASNQSLQAFSLDLSGGVNSNDILLNIPGTNSIAMQGGTYVSILAPGSNVNFSSGLLAGNLIVQNLTGAGQVNLGQFTGFAGDQSNFNTQVPEPSTYMLLGTLLLAIGVANKRKMITAK